MSQGETISEQYSSKEESSSGVLNLLARELLPGRAEQFLLELANLREMDAAAVAKFERRYTDFIPPELKKNAFETYVPSATLNQAGIYTITTLPTFISRLQFLLRRAWEVPSLLDRERHLHETLARVNEQFSRASGMNIAGNPAINRLWKAFGFIEIGLLLAQRVSGQMRRCENPTCPAPYIIAKRGNQRFCCEKCAEPSQREHKRAWWKKNGEEWRKGKSKRERRT